MNLSELKGKKIKKIIIDETNWFDKIPKKPWRRKNE